MFKRWWKGVCVADAALSGRQFHFIKQVKL